MLDSVEKSLQKHVILLLIRELHGAFCVESAHELTELFFPDIDAVSGVALQISDQGLVEAFLSSSIILVEDWSLEQIFDKVGHIDHWNVVISPEVEKKGPEYLQSS